MSTTLQPNARYRTANFGDTLMRLLERICAHDGSIAMRDNKGKSRARQQSCYIYCQYNPKTINLQWKCHDCGMPLCQVNRYAKWIEGINRVRGIVAVWMSIDLQIINTLDATLCRD